MISPSAVAANLACLLYLARHQPGAREELEEAARVFLATAGGEALAVDSTTGWLAVNGQRLPSDSPGAVQVNEHLLGQRVGRVEVNADAVPSDVVAAARILAAYPGVYANWGETVASLVPTEGRVRFSEEEGPAPIVHFFGSEVPMTPDDELMIYSALPLDSVVDEAGLIPDPVVVEPAPPPTVPRAAPASPGPLADTGKLQALVGAARAAVGEGNWSRLLDLLQEFFRAEEGIGEAAARMCRMELRRVISKSEIVQLARLAALGNRREDAIEVLRKLGPDATEILMDLLVESEALGERRGYYSALTRMADGTDIIIHHVSHPLWYVVRNAAELCGEMGLTKAVPDLAGQVTHPDDRVRRSIAAALTQIGTSEAMEPLGRLLKDPAPAVRMFVIGNLDGERTRPLAMPLAAALEREENPDVIREMLRALGRIGTPDALMALRRAAMGDVKRLSRKQRIQAVEGLALAGPGAAPILSALARDGDRELAAAAEQALAAPRS